jgi:RNA polymerase sigma factor (sigma-70 family)
MLVVARRRVATREDAEDVVATALLRTVEHPRLDESRVGAFLCTTVMRLAVDVHRDRARQMAIGVLNAARAESDVPVDEVLCDEDEARWLSRQLQDLPERESQVLTARLSGLTAQQTSASLGLTPKATENAFTRVRQRAQGLLAATLAGVGVILGGGRRLARPELALVPAAVATALVLAVVVGDTQPEHTSTPLPAVALDADPEPYDATEDVSSAPTTSRDGAVSLTAPAVGLPSTHPVQAAPTTPAEAPERTVVRAPAVVDREFVDAGGVALEQRHTDESFEQSVRRCVDNLDLDDPLADSCR